MRRAMTDATPDISWDQAAIDAFCRRWRIVEMSLFGSVLREDFDRDSDVDVLVTFAPDAPWSYWGWGQMTDELERIFERQVDLVEQRSVVNPFRRRHILDHRRVIHRDAA